MSKWSRYRWRPGLPDDPALWRVDGNRIIAVDDIPASEDYAVSADLDLLWQRAGEPPAPQPLRWT